MRERQSDKERQTERDERGLKSTKTKSRAKKKKRRYINRDISDLHMGSLDHLRRPEEDFNHQNPGKSFLLGRRQKARISPSAAGPNFSPKAPLKCSKCGLC